MALSSIPAYGDENLNPRRKSHACQDKTSCLSNIFLSADTDKNKRKKNRNPTYSVQRRMFFLLMFYSFGGEILEYFTERNVFSGRHLAVFREAPTRRKSICLIRTSRVRTSIIKLNNFDP